MNDAALHTDTICAVATPHGTGGIAVVRVSGPDARRIVAQRWKGTSVATMPSHTAHLGHVTDSHGQLLDQVVLTPFDASHSYTGEQVVEIACHGSAWIQQQLLVSLIDAGCRMAQPGEFTRRAFANGRMDLAQAEAVADVIAAQSQAAHRLAINQLRGRFGDELRGLRGQLLHFASLIELELDFSEEEVTFADRAQVIALAEEIHAVISRLAGSYQAGNVIKNGLPVAIVGAVNAGKSTLLNALLHDDRALVSDVQGTTRDVIEDTITLGGTLFRFIDTAGIRQATDVVEQMGIERTWRALGQAEIVLWVIDATAPPQQVRDFGETLVPRCLGKRLIVVVNKIDLADAQAAHRLRLPVSDDTPVVEICAKRPEDVERLQQLVLHVAALPQVGSDTVIVTNSRHYQALTRADQAIVRALQGLRDGLSGDLVSQDISECLHYLGEITGEITSNDILGEIFAHFCIGK